MSITATTMAAISILASGLVCAQPASDQDGLFVVSRDARSNTNEVVSTNSPKLRLTGYFVRLPQEEVAKFRDTFAPAGAADLESWQAALSEMDTRKQLERWKTLAGATIVEQFDVTALVGFAVEINRAARDDSASAPKPGISLNVIPRINTNDTRRVRLHFAGAVINRSSTLPPVERFLGSMSLWDGQTGVIPAEVENQGAAKESESKLLLLLCPVTLPDYDNLVRERK